jgi:DNA-binding MarR family transcriptional regulator
MREATQRLIELGLSDKEASVYLAMLELGPTGVQDIADKAGVNRSTTYTTIEALKQRGLISSSEEDKKIVFTAESPSRLEAILHRERSQIDQRKQRLEEAMPYFMALFNSFDGKPTVRFFEGEEGIAAAREVLMGATGEYLSFTAIDEATLRVSDMNKEQRMRMSGRMHGRLIFSLKPGCAMPETDFRRWEVREIPFDQFSFTGEVNIVGEKIAAFITREQPIAFLVEKKEMADLFRALFEAAWRTAKPYKK